MGLGSTGLSVFSFCFLTMSFGENRIFFLATLRIWLLLIHTPQGQARSFAALVPSPVLLDGDILH